MNLLLDLGNTRLKWAFCGQDEWRAGALTPSATLEADLDRVWGQETPEEIWMAAVGARSVAERVQQWVEARWQRAPRLVVSQAQAFGIRNTYLDPAQLGADRWAALVAARALFQGRLCVVDCGSAMTIDALSEAGEYLGGVILPGLRGMREAVFAAAPGLPRTSGHDDEVLARTTADGIASGVRFGLAGAVERVLEECERALGTPLPVVVTGGDAAVVAESVRYPMTSVPDLVLRGIGVIAGLS